MRTSTNKVEVVQIHTLSLFVLGHKSEVKKYLLVVRRNSGGIVSGVGSILDVETGLARDGMFLHST